MNLTIRCGIDKSGQKEKIESVHISKGEIIGVVGPTGSGKSTLISDIEQLADGDTFSKRHILINGLKPPIEIRTDPRKKIVAQLSQTMHFLADMSVGEFLLMHAHSRNKNGDMIEKVIGTANRLTGEKISKEFPLCILSGGQSRSLMIADIAFISDSPIVLIDEIENAGIKKLDAMKLLTNEGKIVLIITHDPMLALMTNRRIVMENGGIRAIVETTGREKEILGQLQNNNAYIMEIREIVRMGGNIR